MKPVSFRKLALSLEGVIEGAHGGHPDFRAGGKVFASMGYPGAEWGMVKLAPEQQQMLVLAEPEMFVPVKGTWAPAWQNVTAPKPGKSKRRAA